MLRTHKRKLKLNKAQEHRLNRWLGVCRLVYNLGLEVKIDAWKKAQKSVSKYNLMKQLPGLREDYDWIRDVDSQALQGVVERLDRTYQNFFRGEGFPKWAGKHRFKSFTVKKVSLEKHAVIIPKIGKLSLYKDRSIQGTPKTAQLVKEPTGWFICVCCQADHIFPSIPSENQAVGVDMGIANFATFSTGEKIKNPKHFKNYERKLRIVGRSLSRKKKGSNSWKKQAQKLSLLHHKISVVRKDFLHKQSTKYAKKYSEFVMEDLKIRNMVRSAKGDLETSGKNVKAKSGLNKSILDCGWGIFRGMLEYKSNVLKVDPKYTSQTCNLCGNKNAKNRLSQSEFKCTGCGHIAHADVNAAKNILGRGAALIRQREALACAQYRNLNVFRHERTSEEKD